MPEPGFQVFHNSEAVLIVSAGSVLTLPHGEALALADVIVGLLRPRPRPARSRRPSDAELRQLYIDEGLTNAAIARRYGVKPNTVHGWRHQAGIPAHTPKPQNATQMAVARRARLRAVR